MSDVKEFVPVLQREKIWLSGVPAGVEPKEDVHFVWYEPSNVGDCLLMEEVLGPEFQKIAETKKNMSIEAVLEREIQVKILAIALHWDEDKVKKEFKSKPLMQRAFAQIYRMSLTFGDDESKKNYEAILDKMFFNPERSYIKALCILLGDKERVKEMGESRVLEMIRADMESMFPLWMSSKPSLTPDTAQEPSGKSLPCEKRGEVISESSLEIKKEIESKEPEKKINPPAWIPPHMKMNQEMLTELKEHAAEFSIVGEEANEVPKDEAKFPYDVAYFDDKAVEKFLAVAKQRTIEGKRIEEEYEKICGEIACKQENVINHTLKQKYEVIKKVYQQWQQQKRILWTLERANAAMGKSLIAKRAAQEWYLWEWYQEMGKGGIDVDMDMLELRVQLKSAVNRLFPSQADINEYNENVRLQNAEIEKKFLAGEIKERNFIPIYQPSLNAKAPEWYAEKLKKQWPGEYKNLGDGLNLYQEIIVIIELTANKLNKAIQKQSDKTELLVDINQFAA